MENGPQIRVVGNISEKQADNIRESFKKQFLEHASISTENVKKVLKFEREKSEIERILINFANKESNELLEGLGVDKYDIPDKNYHIISSEAFDLATNNQGAVAVADPSFQGIIFSSNPFNNNPLYFGSIALHETLHLKSPVTVEANESNNETIMSLFRYGISALGSQKSNREEKYQEYFIGLNEAIVATQEKKSFKKILDIPELASEKESMTASYIKEMRNYISEREGISEDEILSVDNEGNYKRFSYLSQREVLDYVCIEIQKQFSDQYNSKDKVFEEFLKAHFTGKLLNVARLVERTFGEGSFRQLGLMGTSDSSAISSLFSLEKNRSEQING